MDIREATMKEILDIKSIKHNDYIYAWNNAINFNDGDLDNFGETDLAFILKCLKKVYFKPSSMIFAANWAKSILLDKNFIPFVREHEEKILKPASDLTGEIKRQEHISLIFASACNIGTQVTMFALNQLKDENIIKNDYYVHDDMYSLFQCNILDFLSEINKGTPAQQLQCLLSIDKLMDEYPEQRIGLSKLCELNEPSNFIDIVLKSINEIPEDEKNHLEDILHNLNCYVNAKELKNELKSNNDSISNIKKVKL
jgi:hypothetical protein